MIARHASRSGLYRTPFGAAECSSTVRLRVKIDRQGAQIKRVFLHYGYGISRFEKSMEVMALLEEGSRPDWESWYLCDLPMPDRRALLFYYFEIDSSHGRFYLVPDGDDLALPSRLIDREPIIRDGEPSQPALWQISVYEAFKGPEWLVGSVMYQIFPDRFKRGQDYRFERLQERANAEGALLHQDWDEEVDFEGSAGRGYEANDFFGGSLQGIEEELPYLADLGIEILYLNPINRARSNHRYDAGDYMEVDPLLGTTEDFVRLCARAKDLGIRVILDGVFSHTGADSKYFNKYGRYDSIGAWQMMKDAAHSPYAGWYHFHQKNGTVFYDSWWGFPELPSVHELNLGFRNYICGEDGVIAHWLKLGASGWRLDVSDELPDPFIRAIQKAIRRCKPDAMLMGEIWEDASNKISYGSFRDFILGKTHDCAMGYPFLRALLSWLRRDADARRMASDLESIREHYPPRAFYANMNLISSHDTARAITVLAGQKDPGQRSLQVSMKLSPDERKRGEALLKLAAFFQITWPGVPSLYYGDEIGAEGYRDPFNRRPFDLEQRGSDLSLAMREIFRLRKDYPILRRGTVRILHAEGDLFVFSRSLLGKERLDAFGVPLEGGPKRVVLLLNRSDAPLKLRLRGQEISLAPFEGQMRGDRKILFSLRP